eukprot:gene26082-31943_t
MRFQQRGDQLGVVLQAAAENEERLAVFLKREGHGEVAFPAEAAGRGLSVADAAAGERLLQLEAGLNASVGRELTPELTSDLQGMISFVVQARRSVQGKQASLELLAQDLK